MTGRILYAGTILREEWVGGEPVVANNMIQFLSSNGFKVYREFYPAKGGRIGNSFSGFLRMYLKERDFDASSLKYYVNRIKDIDPDLIIAQYDYDTTIIKAAQLCNKKIMVYLHNWSSVCPKVTSLKNDGSICGGFRSQNCFQCYISDENALSGKIIFRTMIRNNDRIHAKMVARINALSSDNVHTVVLNEGMRKRLTEYGLDERRIAVIGNGIDLNFFKRNDDIRSKVVSYFGGDNRAKGVQIFLSIAKALKDADPEAQFYATGEFKSEVPYVNFTGTVTREKVAKILSESRLVIFPSIWNELFPAIPLEAMACSTPIIAFRNDFTSELITDGENGFICKMGDIDEMTTRVQELLENADKSAALGKNGRKLVEDMYDINKTREKLLQLVTSLTE